MSNQYRFECPTEKMTQRKYVHVAPNFLRTYIRTVNTISLLGLRNIYNIL